MSDPIQDVRKEITGRFDSIGKEAERHGKRLKSAFAFDFVPGDPEGDARRAAEKASLDEKVRASASSRASRYLARKAGKGVVSNVLARGTLG